MDTADKLNKYFEKIGYDAKVVGVPKTIDNDLVMTDHCPGFGSAVKYVVRTMMELYLDINAFNPGRVTVVEIMGRNAGWLTAAPDLLPDDTRPHLFYLPENEFKMEDFLSDVKEAFDAHGYAMVAISEGIKVERDMSNVRVDGFGHAQLGGTAAYLCSVVEEKLNLPTRAIELSLMQRACPVFVSSVDRNEAINTGSIAVQAALKGYTGKMIIFNRSSNAPYHIDYKLADLSLVANAESKITPDLMFDKTRMSDKFREYLKPLIVGGVTLKCEDGIAKVANWKKVLVTK